jgi:hypothetical protein
VYSIGLNTTYVGFGGTSSAGPHVAGAAALLLQADTTLRHRDVRRLLRAGAIADAYTGTVPNTTWGFGKLRINNSLGFATAIAEPLTLPSFITLEQNYPNPFNPSTRIVYRLQTQQPVSLKVFDILGREVATLVHQTMEPGEHSVTLDASTLSSGMYFYRLVAGAFTETRKLMVLK